MLSLGLILDVVRDERQAALNEARRAWRCVKSRGTFVCTAGAGGDQCAPCPEAEALQWSGTKRELEAVIAEVLASYPAALEVYIAGGYDGADTVAELLGDGYEPWVSSWRVTVWRRP